MIDTARFRLVGMAATLMMIAASAARGAAPASSPAAPAPSSAPGPAAPGAKARDPAVQAAGLFMQSCVQFAAQPEALRQWIKSKHLKPVPKPYANDFLYGLPGVVYNATTAAGKLVLVSQDGGSCSVVAESAQGAALLDQLETDLKAAGIAYNVTADGPDPLEKDLHNRAYDASSGGKHWLMLVSTVNDSAGGEAMLTTNP